MSATDSEIDSLVQALAVRNRSVRTDAMVGLRDIGEVAVPALIRTLTCGPTLAQAGAIKVLGAIGPRAAAAVPPLMAMVKAVAGKVASETGMTDEKGQAAAAAAALGRIGDPAAVPCLIEALKDENYLCTCAALALGQIGGSSVVNPLLLVLADNEKFWVPRGAAAVALGCLGEAATDALPALRKALKYKYRGEQEEWDLRAREAVADAIARIRDPSKSTRLKGHGYRYEMWGIF